MGEGGLISLLGFLLVLFGLAAGIILVVRALGRRERVTTDTASPSNRTLWIVLAVGIGGGLFLLAAFPRFFV
ncbi:MAG TPA: hypothetical protein VGW38_10770 [Chloroflexota bacterium]|nr:hypothetical protein [Chloroflexota bacterium]